MRTRTLILAIIAAVAAVANDAVYYAQGSLLVPIRESDIEVKREVLSIGLSDDGFARVEVEYEFVNHSQAKTVEMGFEATRPHNTEVDVAIQAEHPYIEDFSVVMNGQRLDYRVWLVEPGQLDQPLSQPVEEFSPYAYAYCFQAPFKAGVNTVRHTYRYRMSYGVARSFFVPYWLTPATRWRGGSIGDFTLRISALNTAKHFCMPDSLFRGSEFVVTSGTGKVRHHQYEWSPELVEIALRDGTVEWHARNFRPSADLEIGSVDLYTFFTDAPVGTYYDRGQYYVPAQFDRPVDRRIARNLPYANRGYVFKSKDLQRYFEQFWWYMPDAGYVPSTDDFTPREWRLVNEGR